MGPGDDGVDVVEVFALLREDLVGTASRHAVHQAKCEPVVVEGVEVAVEKAHPS